MQSLLQAQSEFFDNFTLGEWLINVIEIMVDWMVSNLDPVFDVIRMPIDFVLTYMVDFLTWLHPLVLLAAIAAIGFYKGGWKLALIGGGGMFLIGALGYWDSAMQTLGMLLAAVTFCVVVGVPLGIFSARSERVEGVVRPALDAMQTIHPFVYLVPVVMFFGIGPVPGTMATIIFALPPMVRLTALGIRGVPKEVVEAGRSFGSDERQLLLDVQLPLAMPTIMAGLNQTLMLALSMVVIVALIAGGGLGGDIFRAVGRLDVGGAVASGIAVLLLAVVLDRISQVVQRNPAS
jgi:glycine betaine/proline transport system permease protein